MSAEREIVEVVVLGRDAASGAFGKVAGSLGAIGTATTLLVTGLISAAAALTTFAVSSVGTAVSVESSFAGILKTTEGLGDSFFDLTDAGEDVLQQFRDLSKEVPLTVEDLMKIGELGGQLGIANDALAGFTKVVADLGVTTNLSTEKAATDLARLANIYDVSTDDMVDNTQRVGAVVVDLGNNFATTESDIVAFGLRLASAGKVAGFTQEDILAIGAAMSSVGVEADRGGTAVQKVILQMSEAVALGGDDLQLFAKTAGMSADQFTAAWNSDPASVFADFVTGLGDAGENAFGILDSLGLKDQRLIQAFLALGNAGDLLNETLDASSTAWDENTALVDEADKRYATTQATWDIIKNQFRDIGLSVGMILLPKLKELLDIASPLIEEFGTNLLGKLDAIEALFSRSTEWKFAKINELLPPEWKEAWVSALNLWISLKDFWAVYGPGIQESIDQIFGGFGEIISHVSEVMGPFVSDVLASFSAWMDENGPDIERIVEAIANVFTEVLVPVLLWAFDILVVNLDGIVNVILDVVSLIVHIFAGDWKAAWESFAQIGKDLLDYFENLLYVFFDDIFSLFGYSTDQFLADWSTFWVNVGDGAKEKWNSFLDWFSSSGLIAWGDGVEEWIRSLNDKILGGIDRVKDFFLDALSDIKSWFGFDVGGSIDVDSSFDISKIANLGAANGFSGVIPPGYPNDSFLMGVTSGETVAVAPANAPVVSMAGAGGGNSSDVPFVYAPVFSLDRKDDIVTALRPIIEEINRDINGGT